MTPYQRLKGKVWSGEAVKFGSLVHHKAPGKQKGGVTQPRWLEGVYLGTRFQSNEHLVSMEDGRVIKARGVQALPEERRWNKEKVLGVVGKPWNPMAFRAFRRPRISENCVFVRFLFLLFVFLFFF